MGGRSGGEELAEAPAKANGERKERREIFGGKQGEGGGPRWTWGLLVRAGNFQRARDLVAGEPPGEGAHVQRNASLPGFFFLLFYFAFWREGPLPISGANLIYYFWWK